MWCDVEHCLTRMLFTTFGITWLCDEDGFDPARARTQGAAFLLEQNGQSPGAASVWSYFRFKSAAGLAYFHKLCGQGSHQGLRQPAWVLADSDLRVKRNWRFIHRTWTWTWKKKTVPVFSQWNICVNIKLHVHIWSLSRTFLTLKPKPSVLTKTNRIITNYWYFKVFIPFHFKQVNVCVYISKVTNI